MASGTATTASADLIKLEGGDGLDAGHLGGGLVVLDVHLGEGDGRRLLAHLGKDRSYPTARRAPLSREVHDALVSAAASISSTGAERDAAIEIRMKPPYE